MVERSSARWWYRYDLSRRHCEVYSQDHRETKAHILWCCEWTSHEHRPSSPGQPVAKKFGGTLKNSWQLEFPELFLAATSTPIIYARGIEEQVDPRSGNQLTLRSEVGGFHSVKLTRAGFQKLVNKAAREVRKF